MPFDALVLDAQLRQSLATVRSLGAQSLRVATATSSHDAPAFASRWCAEGLVYPAIESDDAYFASLANTLEATPARVLFASHDGTIALLRSRRAWIEKRVRLALAGEEALSVAISKERTTEVARRLGIRAPREAIVRDVADVAAALADVPLPVVVKPSESWLQDVSAWMGPKLAVTIEEAQRAVEAITQAGGVALLQQLLTGRREAVSLMFANDEVHARFAQWAKRTRPPLGGASVLRQSIPIPDDIGPQSERLVREIGIEGYSEVEFRRDEDGVPFLMEINPRLSASVEIAIRSGVDFPYLMYRWASGARVDRIDQYRTGGWMRDLGGDIETTIEAIRQRGRPDGAPAIRAVLGFGLSFMMPARYDYLDLNDPRPALRASSNFARSVLGRVRRRARKIFS